MVLCRGGAKGVCEAAQEALARHDHDRVHKALASNKTSAQGARTRKKNQDSYISILSGSSHTTPAPPRPRPPLRRPRRAI